MFQSLLSPQNAGFAGLALLTLLAFAAIFAVMPPPVMPLIRAVRRKLTVLALAVSAALSGCATITQGAHQSVLFDTSPSGAVCSITREGNMLYADFTAPKSLQIEKDKDDLVITCDKEGYRRAVIHTNSSFEGWTMGNLLLGGIIGLGVDAASGAINEYPSQVVVRMEKE